MTNHRWVFALAALGLVCTLPARSSAQQAPVPTPGVIKINVNLVQVDAVVTDAKGNPVTDLRAEDFEVLQDKRAQQIRNFEFVRVRAPRGSTPVRGAAPAGLPLPPATVLRPDQIRRTIALVVDDIALSADGTVRTRDALRHWVDNEMQPGDLVSVVRTNAATGALQQFSGDKRLLYSAIERVKFQPGRIGVDGLRRFGSGGDGPSIVSMAAFDRELESAQLTGSLNAIRYVMQGLRDLPGRKSVVLFSEDMAFPDVNSAGGQRMEVEDRLRRLGDEANRSSVVINAIDPRGGIFTESQDAMVLLSQRTGGLFFSNNDLAGSLRRVVDDGDGYYLMGYLPELGTFNAMTDTAKYHSIGVRVKRPGLKVRSRTGFFGLADADPASATPASPQAQLANALVSPFTTADLRVRLTTLLSQSDIEGTYIKTLLHFDARDLTFTESADGSSATAVDIAVVTFDENGDPAETVNKTWSLRVPKEGYEDVLRKGLVYSVPVPIKKAGPYQLRVALRDATSQKLGSAMQFIDVPDLKSGRLALSGIVVSAEPQNPNTPEGTPAVRVFRSGGAFSYAYEILNARTNSKESPQLEMQMRLYRENEMVYQSAPAHLNTEKEKDAKRIAVGGLMQLTKIPPGDYVMQVTVFDSLKPKDKNRVATQTIDFEVR